LKEKGGYRQVQLVPYPKSAKTTQTATVEYRRFPGSTLLWGGERLAIQKDSSKVYFIDHNKGLNARKKAGGSTPAF